MDELQNLMKMYPHLIVKHNFTEYDGFLDVGGSSFRVRLTVPNYPSLKELSLECSWKASCALEGYKSLMNEWILQGSLISFLENLKTLLEKEACGSDDEKSITAQSFRMLASDLKNIGFCNVSFISQCLTEVTFQIVDKSSHTHSMIVNVGKNYPHQALESQASLPESALETIRKNEDLEEVFNSFEEQVSSLQHLWNILDLVDEQCCVLDPENPTRKDLGRRILIENGVSLYFNMDLSDVHNIPSIAFLGPEQLVQKYQSNVAANSKLWNSFNNFLDNLKLLLGLQSLPCKNHYSEQESLVHQGECCICFTLRLDGKLPSEVCDNAHCASNFHSACLFEWLQSGIENYQSFDRYYGVCPNCGVAISCPIPS